MRNLTDDDELFESTTSIDVVILSETDESPFEEYLASMDVSDDEYTC